MAALWKPSFGIKADTRNPAAPRGAVRRCCALGPPSGRLQRGNGHPQVRPVVGGPAQHGKAQLGGAVHLSGGVMRDRQEVLVTEQETGPAATARWPWCHGRSPAGPVAIGQRRNRPGQRLGIVRADFQRARSNSRSASPCARSNSVRQCARSAMQRRFRAGWPRPAWHVPQARGHLGAFAPALQSRSASHSARSACSGPKPGPCARLRSAGRRPDRRRCAPDAGSGPWPAGPGDRAPAAPPDRPRPGAVPPDRPRARWHGRCVLQSWRGCRTAPPSGGGKPCAHRITPLAASTS